MQHKAGAHHWVGPDETEVLEVLRMSFQALCATYPFSLFLKVLLALTTKNHMNYFS